MLYEVESCGPILLSLSKNSTVIRLCFVVKRELVKIKPYHLHTFSNSSPALGKIEWIDLKYKYTEGTIFAYP